MNTQREHDEKLPRHCEVCGGLMGDMSVAAYIAACRVCDDCEAEKDFDWRTTAGR